MCLSVPHPSGRRSRSETMSKDGWKNATKSHPCPICQKTDYCAYSVTAVLCHRVESDKPTKTGWLHKRDGHAKLVLPPKEKKRTAAEIDSTLRPIMQKAWRECAKAESELAKILGVAEWTLQDLGCGWLNGEWLFPERDHRGLIVGIGRRLADGKKMTWPGGSRGLTYSPNSPDGSVQILLVEGPSD